MFAKDKVSQSMIDAVKGVMEEIVETTQVDESEKVKTDTGVKVYGSSYGNSERARREQLKRPVDDTKGPSKSELTQMAKVKKENFAFKDKLIEGLKGKQTKLDKNHNNKLDAQDFAILRGQQKEKTETNEAVSSTIQKNDKPNYKNLDVADKKEKMDRLKTPAKPGPLHNVAKGLGSFLKGKPEPMESVEVDGEQLDEKAGYSAKAARAGKDIGKPGKAFGKIAKKAGERYGSAEAGKRVAGAILAKIRAEEAEADWTDEQIDALLEYYELEEKHMTDSQKSEQERIVRGMKKGFAGFRKRYGERAKSVMYATATKQAMGEETLEEGKPDFLDLDKDGNKTEPMKQAAKQSKNTKKEVEEEIDPKKRTKDNLVGRKPTDQDNDVGRSSDFKSTKVKFRGGPMQEGKTLSPGQDDAPFDPPYTTGKPDNVKDKSGAVHTPMSRARDLARQAMKRIKTEMLGKAPGNN